MSSERDGLLSQKSIPRLDQMYHQLSDERKWLIVFVLALGNASDAVEIIKVVQIIFQNSDGFIDNFSEFLSAAVFIGMLMGGITFGYFSDVFGRKPCLVVSFLINALAGLISSFSTGVVFLILCRVIAGIGIGGSVPIVFSLGSEIFPKNERGKLLSVIASFWMVGAIFSALTGWVMLGTSLSSRQKIMPSYVNWRWFAVLSSFPAFAVLILSWLFLPESPLFLRAQAERRGEAREGSPDLDISSDEHCGGEASNHAMRGDGREEGEILETVNPIHPPPLSPLAYSALPPSSFQSNYTSLPPQLNSSSFFLTLSHLFSPRLIRPTLSLLLIWFTLSFASYGLSTWISVLFADIGLANPYFDSLLFALANLPGNLVSVYWVDSMGRRRLLILGMVLASLSACGFAFGSSLPHTNLSSFLIVLCACLFNASSVCGWNSLDCLSVETFPTPCRASAMGFLAAAGRLGSVIAQFVNGSLEGRVPVLLFVSAACMLIGGGASQFGLREEEDCTGKEMFERTPEDSEFEI